MNENVTIKNLPEHLRPQEKCRMFGPAGLSDEELLAIILRSGTQGRNSLQLAADVLASGYPEGILGLEHYTLQELMSINGIGEVKAMQLLCIGELALRIARTPYRQGMPQIQNTQDLFAYYSDKLRHCEQEELHILSLDSQNRVIHDSCVFRGTVSSAPASPREIFLEAGRHHAVRICAAHNHPGGDSSPSREDMQFTIKLLRCANFLGIQLVDHIIIGDHNYFSFKERGLLDI